MWGQKKGPLYWRKGEGINTFVVSGNGFVLTGDLSRDNEQPLKFILLGGWQELVWFEPIEKSYSSWNRMEGPRRWRALFS